MILAAGSLGAFAVIAVLVDLERRAVSSERQLVALREQVASVAQGVDAHDRASRMATMPWAQGPATCAIDSDTVDAITRAVANVQARHAAADAGAGAPPPRSADQETKLADAQQVLKQALARGKLSRDDVLRMRLDLQDGGATGAERDAIRSEIAVAVNGQRLVPEDRHFVFP